jgi:hypothetical protein
MWDLRSSNEGRSCFIVTVVVVVVVVVVDMAGW